MAEANNGLPEERQIVLRVGINLGDVVVDGGDLYGDGVNVAARLQSIAGPGDICVSGSVYDQVKRKLDLGFDELGPQTIKNISEPVAVYRVGSSSRHRRSITRPAQIEAAAAARPSPRLPCFRSPT